MAMLAEQNHNQAQWDISWDSIMDKANKLNQLAIDLSIPVRMSKCGVVNEYFYLPEATEDHRALGSKIADNFDKAVMDVNGNTITAIVDKQDTHVIFSVWNASGALQFSKTVEIINGVASYMLDATPGLYRVRAYGTISFVSGFVEVTVT